LDWQPDWTRAVQRLAPAEKLYRQAVAAFQETLDRALRNRFFPAPEATLALRIELARCLPAYPA